MYLKLPTKQSRCAAKGIIESAGSDWRMILKRSIARLNREYNDVLQDARRRLQRQRVDLDGRRGRVQSVHVNAQGVRVDILLDDGHFEENVDALRPCYDP